MTDRVLKMGAIGCGGIFNGAHMPAILQIPGVELTALYDTNPVAAETTKYRIQARLRESINEIRGGLEGALEDQGTQESTSAGSWTGYSDILRILARANTSPEERLRQLQHNVENVTICQSAEELVENVDLVDVCAGARWHGVYAAMALDRGVHVLTEKPMARTWWEARKIKAAAERSGTLYQLCDDNVFIPRYLALRNAIESSMIGELQSIWLCRGWHGPNRGWFFDPKVSGGGALMDYGTHGVTATWFLVGFDKVPVRIKSTGIRARHRTRILDGRLQTMAVDDDAHLKILYEDAATGDWITVVMEATWSWPELGPEGGSTRGYILVEGTEGTITGYVDEKDRDFLKVSRYGYGDKLIQVQSVAAEKDSHEKEIRNFIECIRSGQRSILNEDVGLGVMEILGSAYLSEVRGGRAVAPAEFHQFSQEIGSQHADDASGGLAIVEALMKPFGTIFSQ
jgi:predicted dehydrogenase